MTSAIMATGIMGVASVGIFKTFSTSVKTQKHATSVQDEIELKTQIRMILDDERYCRVSLAGNGPVGTPNNPVTFNKSNIDQDGEGLDVELYLSDQSGENRGLKKISATDPSKSKYGGLYLTGLKLVMNNLPGADYAESPNHVDQGEIRLELEKSFNKKRDRKMKYSFPVQVTMSTDNTGLSTILACNRIKLEEEPDEFYYPNTCSMLLGQSDNGGPWKTITLNMDSGGWAGLRLLGGVNSDDVIRLDGNCNGGGNDLSNYINNCSLGLGQKDSTLNNGIHSTPTNVAIGSFSGGVNLSLVGNVNSDDSFYIRMNCPNGADADLNDYVKTKCMICLGQGDNWRSTPESRVCRRVQNAADGSWGRLVLEGDVNTDDVLFIGFFCNGEYSDHIKAFAF